MALATLLCGCGICERGEEGEPYAIEFRDDVSVLTKVSEYTVSSLRSNGFLVSAAATDSGEPLFSNDFATYSPASLSWKFSPSRYWHRSNAYNIFAVYPSTYSLSGSGPALRSIAVDAALGYDGGDMLVSSAYGRTGANSGADGVTLHFIHPLAYIAGVRMRLGSGGSGIGISVTGVTISSPASAVYYLGAGIPSFWADHGQSGSVSLSSSPTEISLTSYTELRGFSGRTLIPTPSGEYEMSIRYNVIRGGTIVSADNVGSVSVRLNPGQRSTVDVTYDASSSRFSSAVSIRQWDNGTDSRLSFVKPTKYLRFSSDVSVKFILSTGSLLRPYFEYSLDEGDSWEVWGTGSNYPEITFGADTDLLLRGRNTSGLRHGYSLSNYIRFGTSGNSSAHVSVSGNLMGLLDYENDTDIVEDHAFYLMFSNFSTLRDASGLILPEQPLTESCFQQMFEKCVNLVSGPDVPSAPMSVSCCEKMFYGCTSLAAAPSMPSMSLAESCYAQMYYNCNSMTSAVLPAHDLVENCYFYLFYGCSSLNYVKAMFAAESRTAMNWCKNMLSGVASNGTFVRNPDAYWYPGTEYLIPSLWTIVNASE